MKRASQSGQALVEVAIALVGLMAVMLIVLFIAGVGIANIQTLLDARTVAESRSIGALPGRPAEGGDIKVWVYDGIVPFTPRDRGIASGDAWNFNAVAQDALNNPGWSAPWPENRYFRFVGMDDLPEYFPDGELQSSRLRERPFSYAQAAALVSGTAHGARDNVFSPYWEDEMRRSFRWSFGKWFGVNIDRLDLRGRRANMVFFPAGNKKD